MNVRKSGVTDNKKHRSLVPEPSSSSKLISLRNHFSILFIYSFIFLSLFRI